MARGIRKDVERGGWRVERRWTVDGVTYRRARRFRRKREAQLYAKELDEEIKATKVGKERLGLLPVSQTESKERLTLKSFAQEFFVWLQASEASPSTIAGYRSHFRSTIEPVLGDFDLGDITPVVVDQLRLGLRELGREPRGPLVPLSSLLTLAVERGHIERNPCHNQLRRRRSARAGGRKEFPARSLSAAQRRELYRAWRPDRERERTAFVLGAWCGLRLGEIRGLRPQDCHVEERWLNIELNIVRGGAGPLIERPPKSGRARIVPMSEWTANELEPWVAMGRPYLLADDVGRPIRGDGSRSALTRAFRAAQKKAGIIPPIRFHDLRATAASCWVADGVPRAIVKTILGHVVDSGLGEDVLERHYERIGLKDMQRWVK